MACHDDRRESMRYEPHHDIRHRAPNPWRPPRLVRASLAQETPGPDSHRAGTLVCCPTRSPDLLTGPRAGQPG